jgi:hypothetical protein
MKTLTLISFSLVLGGWRILVSSESITGASSLRAGILLWQKLTTPQVSMNICASG